MNTAAIAAIDCVGGPAKLAQQLLGEDYTKKEYLLMQRRVCSWKEKGVAAKFVVKVEYITGYSRYVLRPDIFQKEVSAA